MASKRHLKDLLEEDQEPFQLHSYISDIRCQINRQVTHLQVKKRRNAGNAFGIFGSVLKKLTQRKKREISGRIITRKSKGKEEEENDYNKTQKIASEFSRWSSSSGVWSESVTNGERSWSCTSQSDGSDQMDEYTCESMNGADLSEDKRFCESPFHFVLQTNPFSGGFRTPNFSSHVAPSRRDCQEIKKESYEAEKLKKVEMEEEEEEDKEQNSPVSVLDPPFQDDDEDIHMDDYNISSTFRSVQKAKHLLLQKLCRFEQLAGLDPMELEKRISEQEMKHLYRCENITQRIVKTYFEEVPEGVEALISDLVAEESQSDNEAEIAIRVCERLRYWRDVESNTIDMMVEHDLRSEGFGLWRSKNDAEVVEMVLDIEFDIFEDLVEELSEDIGGES